MIPILVRRGFGFAIPCCFLLAVPSVVIPVVTPIIAARQSVLTSECDANQLLILSRPLTQSLPTSIAVEVPFFTESGLVKNVFRSNSYQRWSGSLSGTPSNVGEFSNLVVQASSQTLTPPMVIPSRCNLEHNRWLCSRIQKFESCSSFSIRSVWRFKPGKTASSTYEEFHDVPVSKNSRTNVSLQFGSTLDKA